jgi:1,4-alpha-glucan branching enzyme
MTQKNHRLPIVERDEWLWPVEDEIAARHERYVSRLAELAGGGTLSDFANGYKWFGFQRDDLLSGWWFREWLPGAQDVWLTGDFNDWNRTELRLERGAGGVWSLFLPDALYGARLVHGSLYKIHVHGANGFHDRIPAYALRVVQDEGSKDYAAQFWAPKPFDWGDFREKCPSGALPLLIYEAHVGMAQEAEGVGTYVEFTETILPRIAAEGYNTLQLMAVAEHPYYGSFGYHVSNFFAVSSRSGTPEELKALIKRAHEMGIAVVMDLVHAHYVKNLNEGLASLDGTDHHYSRPGDEGYQKYWDSMLFDYGKTEVTHFLLSNVKFWLDEFNFDGFRFDGVTSMIYHHHGYTEFDSRDKFFGPDVNTDALTYLTLANRLVHEIRPDAVTIAEDVSGMPGMALPIADGGVGFDYRLGMAIPDFWIRLLKEVPDERWNIWEIWNILTDRLPGVHTVAYAESHDQALVGDKTIAFRLMDAAMYTSMARVDTSPVVERGMALHKMIRLVTIAAGGDAYLNFMGNEFGHPEWIDFPRAGNGWSYGHARRQWSLADSPGLRYGQLLAFDGAMIGLVKRAGVLCEPYPWRLQMDEPAQTMVFARGRLAPQVAGRPPGGDEGDLNGVPQRLVFVFNWHPTHSQPDYTIEVPEPGKYRLVLSTDDERFGGQGRHNPATEHFSFTAHGKHYIQVYNVCRTAAVFQMV